MMNIAMKKFTVCVLTMAIVCGALPMSSAMAQETASSLQFEIDTLKNQVLKLQADVYTKTESGEDPECSTISVLSASIEGEIREAEARGKTIRSEVERKREAKKKLNEELAFYDRMFLDSAEKTAIYSVVTLAATAGMIAMGVENKKIQDRLDEGNYPTGSRQAIQAAGDVSMENANDWLQKCTANCGDGEECIANCNKVKETVEMDYEKQAASAEKSPEEVAADRKSLAERFNVQKDAWK